MREREELDLPESIWVQPPRECLKMWWYSQQEGSTQYFSEEHVQVLRETVTDLRYRIIDLKEELHELKEKHYGWR